MSVLAWIILILLCWYPVGILSLGVVAASSGPSHWGDWRDDRRFAYKAAWLGPVCPIIILCLVIHDFFDFAKNFIRKTGAPRVLVNLADWIIAGFRKPPTQPAEDPL